MSHYTTLSRLALVPALALGLTAVVAVESAEGQRNRRGPAQSVEQALRLADELELTGEQRESLESMRQELVTERIQRSNELIELRSQVGAGIREPEAMRSHVEGMRSAAMDAAEARREQLTRLLTEDQRQALRSMTRHSRDGFRGRRGGRDQRGLNRERRSRSDARRFRGRGAGAESGEVEFTQPEASPLSVARASGSGWIG